MTTVANSPRRLYCCCCGAATVGRQFHNQDTGFGLCPDCLPVIEEKAPRHGIDVARTYGIRGYHFDLDFSPATGSPEWADIWEATHGRENLDAVTIRNLDEMRKVSAGPISSTISAASAKARATMGRAIAHEITEDVYYEALNALPPVYGPNGHWWLGEAYTHNDAGKEIALECWREGSRHFCRLSVVKGGGA